MATDDTSYLSQGANGARLLASIERLDSGTPDPRGVTALREQEPDILEVLFWEQMCAMEFDPSEPGPQFPEPEPWNLEQWQVEQEFPPSLREQVAALSGRVDVTGYLFERQQLEEYIRAREGGGEEPAESGEDPSDGSAPVRSEDADVGS